MTMNIDKIRSETPDASSMHFLHNAGSSLTPKPIVDAMIDYLRLEQRLGGYGAAIREAHRLDAVYDSVAKLINASPDEIALVENATVAWQMAFYSLQFAEGDRILTGQSEYGANFVAFLQMAKRTGAVIDVIPSTPGGDLDLNALRQMIDDRVKLIAITWIPTNGGLTYPAEEIGAIAREAGIPYLLDACQALGQIDVNVEAIGCDMLSATGRKFLRGPRGSGFLYMRRKLMLQLEPPMIDHFAAPWVATNQYKLREDAKKFENWENNYAARLGLGLAVDYAMEIGIDQIEKRCRELSSRLRSGLRDAGVIIRDLGSNPSSIVSFSVDGMDASAVTSAAAARNIVIGMSKPQSTRLDAEARDLPIICRASPHYYNTTDDVDRLIELCADLKK